MMLFLSRKISQYSGPDLFLGVFTDHEAAEDARRAYLRSIAVDDPWREQAYRTSSPEQDVQINELSDNRASLEPTTAFMVTAHFECMGQVSRRPLGVFSTKETAMSFGQALEDGDAWDPNTPNWCDVEEVHLNRPLIP